MERTPLGLSFSNGSCAAPGVDLEGHPLDLALKVLRASASKNYLYNLLYNKSVNPNESPTPTKKQGEDAAQQRGTVTVGKIGLRETLLLSALTPVADMFTNTKPFRRIQSPPVHTDSRNSGCDEDDDDAGGDDDDCCYCYEY